MKYTGTSGGSSAIKKMKGKGAAGKKAAGGIKNTLFADRGFGSGKR